MKYCRICNSNDLFRAVWSVEDYFFKNDPGVYDFWCCTSCRSLNIAPKLHGSTLDAAYATYYTKTGKSRYRKLIDHFKYFTYPKLTQFSFSLAWMMTRIKGLRLKTGYLKMFLVSRNNSIIVDIGCGDAELGNYFRRSNSTYIGYEIDERCVENGRLRSLDIRLGDVHTFASDFSDNSIDVVYLSHVLEHVDDPKLFLSLVVKKLTKGGFCVVSTPNAQATSIRQFGRYWRGLEAPRHLHLLSEHWLEQFFAELNCQKEFVDHSYIRLDKESEKIQVDRSDICITDRTGFFDEKNDIIDLVFRKTLR